MLRRISWRNIWRNKGRSSVVIGAIALGIWSLIFTYAFMNSFLDGYIKNQILYETSHIQIHNPEFKTDFEIKYTIENGDEMLKELQSSNDHKAIAHRSVSNGMIASPRKARGIKINGIIPEEEMKLSNIDSFVSEGTFFENVKRNPIVIGYRLAKKLKVKLRSKVVLTFQDINGDIVSGAFRICGIINSSSPTYNEMVVLVKMEDLNKLLGIGEEFHEIAMIEKEKVDEIQIAEQLKIQYKNHQVEGWNDLAPELEYFQKSSEGFLYVLQIIIMIALIFGIINTMLMSVLERFKELGMLMAVGMNKWKVFFMIMMETLFLALVGSPIGLLLAIITVVYLEQYGIDLSAYSASLESYGYDNVLYPYVKTSTYFQVIFGVFITAILGAIYPAVKAVKLKPVDALHKI